MSEINELRMQLEQKTAAYQELGVIAQDRRRLLEAKRTEIAGLEQASEQVRKQLEEAVTLRNIDRAAYEQLSKIDQKQRRELEELRKEGERLRQNHEKMVERQMAYDAEVLRLHAAAASQFKCTTAAEAATRRWARKSGCFVDVIRGEINAHVARAKQLRAVYMDLEGCPEGQVRLEALEGIHQKVAADLAAMMVAANKAWAESAIRSSAKPTEAEGSAGAATQGREVLIRGNEPTEPDDFVMSTGASHTVREFLSAVFDMLEMDWQDHVELDGPCLH